MAGAPSQATLTIKNGPDAGRVIDLPQAQGELLIGRVEPAGLVINDSEVSRRHARLTFRDGRYYLEDLRSVNGTILRGQRISGECDLSNGDEIFIGSKVILVFHQIQQKPELAPESMTGHLLGAAGGLEFAVSLLVATRGRIPPTINQEVSDPDCDLDCAPNVAVERPVRVALSNSFGFGGHNVTLAVRAFTG